MKLQLACKILIAGVLGSSSINGDDDVQHTRKLSSLKDDVGSGCANHVDFRGRFLTTTGEECNACSLCSENNMNQMFVPKAKDVCITCSSDKGTCDVLELITEFSEGWPIKFVTLTASDMDSKYDPQESTFLGSNDGKNWVEITSTKVEFKERTDALQIFLENDISFTHYAMQLKGLDKMTYVGKYGIVESYTKHCTAQLHQKITGVSIPSYVTMAPTSAPGHEFNDKSELQGAIRLWKSNEVEAEKTYGHIRDWEVGKITNFSHVLWGSTTFNEDLSNWDTSNVTDMLHAFSGCEKFNQDISTWNTAKLVQATHMFHHAHEFNQDLSAWNLSSVKSMHWMFWHCESFDQVLCWDNKFNDGTVFTGAKGGSFNPDYPNC